MGGYNQWDESRVQSSYGDWTVIGLSFGEREKRRIPCRCKCGFEMNVLYKALKNGRSWRCVSCARRESESPRHITHGATVGGNWTPEYCAWKDMLTRCFNPKFKDYHLYGGRGITVCKRWQDSFSDFLSDVGPKPAPHHSLDRFPNMNGNYEPGNVRWATATEQANNRRPRSARKRFQSLSASSAQGD